jgi:hypothetical protein
MAWAVVVPIDVVADGHDQFFDITKDAAAEPVLGKIAEEAFHHVEPGTTGRCEVCVEPCMVRQPLLNPGIFVGRIVVHDQVDFLALRV